MPLPDHSRNHRLCHDKRRIQVNVDYLAELFGGHLQHGDSLDDTGIVYQDVDHSDLFLDLCHHGLYLLLVRHVAHIAVRFDALLLVSGDSLIHQLLLNVVEDNGCTRIRICACNRKANSVGSARHQRNLALQ